MADGAADAKPEGAADGAVESKSEATADGPPDAKRTKRTVMESDSDSDDD